MADPFAPPTPFTAGGYGAAAAPQPGGVFGPDIMAKQNMGAFSPELSGGSTPWWMAPVMGALGLGTRGRTPAATRSRLAPLRNDVELFDAQTGAPAPVSVYHPTDRATEIIAGTRIPTPTKGGRSSTPPRQRETVGQAAIRLGDRTFTGRNHLEAMETAERELGLPAAQFNRLLASSPDDGGFLTSTGRYVSRSEANLLARAANQIPHQNRGELTSERLAQGHTAPPADKRMSGTPGGGDGGVAPWER